jgi:RNA 2',3'-cyclic 3'-phosphodiesterase
MQTTRTFIAVEVADPARSVVLRLLKQLQSDINGVRWTQPEQLHITLKFLGDIDNRLLPAICTQLRNACRNVEHFGVTLQGLGAFPKNKPPRVLWLGVQTQDTGRTSSPARAKNPAEISSTIVNSDNPLCLIQERLENSLYELGIPREGRGFRPHLTLGRINRGADQAQIAQRIAREPEALIAQFDVHEIALFASFRERNRMVYETLDTVELE